MRKKIVFGVLFVLLLFGIYGIFGLSVAPVNQESTPHSSAISEDFIPELLEDKSLEYGQKGYFPNIYEPSLQATYYGLSVLNAIGRLDVIHKPNTRDFIMSFYDNTTKLFWDSYAYRATDLTSFERPYPLASLLEINCYAVLSLEMLGYIHLIDSTAMIDFVMSCINSTTSGFIGQEYDPNLFSFEKVATADNTFYAIQIIDLLSDWSAYPNLRNNIISFINALQDQDGGFFNDQDKVLSSLGYNEPNMASNYYCIKSLEMLNDLTGFNNNTFKTYMMGLYDNVSHSFRFFAPYENDYDIIATAMGMEIAKIMNFQNVDINNCMVFLVNMRNSYGIWGSTVRFNRYELIDNFQVIRSIKEIGKISTLSYQDLSIIASATINLYYTTGFSLISEHYSSTQTLYTLITSFDLYDRVLELLPIGYLTAQLESMYKYYSVTDYHTFLAVSNLELERSFRSLPIEYYNEGDHSHIYTTDLMSDHKSMYHALRSLQYISKLEEFQSVCNLTELLHYVIDCQFVEDDNYENYGGFLPRTTLKLYSLERQNHSIYFESSYYAVKTLQFLADFLGIESLVDLGFDANAFLDYVNGRIRETSSELYFDPIYATNPEIVLEQTYYACEIYTSLGSLNHLTQKIKNYINNHLSYRNLKNVYYSYKLSELLHLNIYFVEAYIYNLTEYLYTPSFKEFYLNDAKQYIEQEALLWVADLLLNFENPNINPVVDYKSMLPHALTFFTFFPIAFGTVFYLTKKGTKKLDLKNLKKKLKFK
ncbi:MAG: hypothetical protein ACFE8J_09115 [Candidatus Heimdallarchaeota archaeon]